MTVYDEADERRLRARIGAFENVTVASGHLWRSCDLTYLFAQWMAAQEYRESYFETPEDLEMALPDINDGVRMNIRPFMTADVLRGKPNIKWGKDRGKNPDGTDRLNDLHLTRAEKEAARRQET